MMRLKNVLITSSPKKLVSSLLAIFITLLVIWVQGVKLFPNGVIDNSANIIFYGGVLFHDSHVHLSLISEMLNRFPPTDFTFGGAPLHNYHYLYDAFLTTVIKLTGIAPLDLYFRLMPVVLSVGLSLVIYLTIWQLTKNRWASAFGIFITIFSTSLGSVLPFIKTILRGNHVTGGSNIFMTDQLIDMLVNPQGALSLIMFLTLFLLLCKKRFLLFALLLGVSFGVKAYGGIIFILAAVSTVLITKDKKLFLAVFLGGLLMTGWILFTIDGKVAGMQLAPGWILEKMMIEMDRFNEPRSLLLIQHYQATGNWLRIGLLEFVALIIYLVGSLGIRIFGFAAVIFLIKKWQNLTSGEVFLLITSATSLLIPLIFNQTKKAYDVVQFTPYFTLSMGIFLTMIIFKTRFKAVVLMIVILITFGQNWQEIRSRIVENTRAEEKIVISRNVVEAANYVRSETSKDAIFLLAPTEFNINKPWFPAVFARRTVYCCRGFAFQVGVDTDQAEENLKQTFAGTKKDTKFDYVFLKRSEEEFARIKTLYTLTPVYENVEVQILRRENL